MKFATLVFLGLASIEESQAVQLEQHHGHHNKHHAKKWWTDGNNAGSEKQDTFWDMGHESATAGEFDNLARHPKISSSSYEDFGEPTYHSNGFTASFNQMKQKQHHHHKKNQGIHSTAQHKPQHWWADGNGGGSEKQDTFWEMGHHTATGGEFDNLARHPKITSLSDEDSAPAGHPNGATASFLQKNSKYNVTDTGKNRDYWHELEFESANVTKKDFWDQAGRHPGEDAKSYWDAQPAGHSNGATAAFQHLKF